MFLPLRRKINYEIFVQMLLKGFLPSLCDVLYDSLAKSDLCLIGLFSCSANFITRFVIPSAGIFFSLHNKAFRSHGKGTTLSLLFICLGLYASPLRYIMSHPNGSLVDSGTESCRRLVFTPFAYKIHF